MIDKADTTDFEYTVTRPNPGADFPRLRKQGSVDGYHGKDQGCFLTFSISSTFDDTIEIESVKTHEPYRCKGCAKGLVDALRDAYPGLDIIDGLGTNSCEGDRFVAAMIAKGKMRPRPT
jgi:hypothetical protein